MPLIYSASAPSVRGKRASEMLQYTITETPVYDEGSRFSTTADDIIYDAVTSASVRNNAVITVDNISLEEQNSVHIEASNAKALVSGSDIRHVSDGFVDITCRAYNLGAKKFTRFMFSGGGTAYDVTGYAVGSLARHVYDATMALISGKTWSKAITQYIATTNEDNIAPAVTLNPDVFTGALDFSGVSVMSGGESTFHFPHTLITPRHAVVSKHAAGGIGGVYVFRRTDGTYQSVTILDITVVENSDIAVVYFSAAVTGTAIYKTMPLNWHNYSPSLIVGSTLLAYPNIPMIAWRAHYADGSWGSAIQVVALTNLIIVAGQPVGAGYNFKSSTVSDPYAQWGASQAIGGDSGSPNFMLVNGELVNITSCHHINGGDNIANVTAEINAIMNTQAGTVDTYALSHPNLAAFTDYSI